MATSAYDIDMVVRWWMWRRSTMVIALCCS